MDMPIFRTLRRSSTLLVAGIAAMILAFTLSSLVRTQGSGLVAAYGFSEASGPTTADLSGNGNAGTLMNGTARIAEGRFGPALEFDGIDDGVRMPANSPTLVLTGSFTIAAWVRPTGPHTAVRQIIQAQGGNGEGLRVTAVGRPQFRAEFPAGVIQVTGSAAVPVEAWTHVAVVYDGASLGLYVNGAPVASAAASGAMVGDGRVWFGRTRGGGNPLAGQLDDVRIYARALTPAEVALDVATPVDPATPFQVSTVTPEAGAFGVVTTPVAATLSAAANPATVTSATAVLLDATATPVPSTVAYDAATRRVTLTPLGALAPLMVYTARLSGGAAGVVDTLGREMAGDMVWTFRTAADSSAPSAAYAFSEGAGPSTVDGSDNGHVGTLVGGPTWTTDGQYGGALAFDGVDDAVEIPVTDAVAVTDAFTVEAWIKVPATPAAAQMVVQFAGDVNDGLRLTTDGRPRLRVTLDGVQRAVAAPWSVPVDVWTHVAATYDGTLLRLYMDGSLAATNAATGSVAGRDTLLVGRGRQGGLPFLGTLDEVRLYRRALTPAEILFDVTTPVDAATAFRVTRTTPSDGAMGVVSTPITATFSSALLESSLTTEAFMLEDGTQSPVAATVAYDAASRTATLTPDAPLESQALYTARVRAGAGGVLSASSAELPGDVVWWFVTAADASTPSAAYALDETTGLDVSDASGNGLTGTLGGGTAWTMDGRYGGAVLFDGVDAGVDLPASDALAFSTAFTLETWVRPDADTGTLRQIVQLPSQAGGGLKIAPNGRPRVRIDLPTGIVRVTGPTPLPVGTWSHLAATYDGTALRLYVDGTEIGSAAAAGALAESLPMSLGRTRTGGQLFVGALDEVRIYRRALAAEEIASDMTTPILDVPPPPPPVSLVVSPQSASVAPGATFPFYALATYVDGTVGNVTESATWSSADPMTATVAEGLATGLQAGTVTVTASLSGLSATAQLQVAEPPPPPPSPLSVAPPLVSTVPTTIRNGSAFLYEGATPIQVDVPPGTIESRRAAVVRGVVLTRSGQPLDSATVRIKDHPEFGSTRSRADGAFDLAVNGGGSLVVQFEKAGFLQAARDVEVPWEHVSVVPDVAMVPLDSQATAIDLLANTPMQVARGSVVTDGDGSRRATVLFPLGTAASLVMPNGTTQPLRSLTVRATEYTVGAAGLAAMPASLPPTSAFTYAVELSVDEALATDARAVQFSTPIPFYVENFLGLPAGSEVPAGYYDRTRAAWIASENARVVTVIGATGELADLDVDGDGQADVGDPLVALAVTDDERRQLATLYQPGQSLWRARVPHFSPWDFNLAASPNNLPSVTPRPQLVLRGRETSNNCQTSGSIIECQNQTLGEDVPITGTPFNLTYRSTRAEGRASRRSIGVDVTQSEVPESLESIEVRMRFGGREVVQQLAPQANQQVDLTWDGRDEYGRRTFGTMPTDVLVTYAYGGSYMVPDRARAFGIPGGTPSGTPSRRPALQYFPFRTELTGTPPSTTAVAGWSLSPHHVYDPVGRVLYRGDGTQTQADATGQISREVSRTPGATPVFGPDGSRYNLRMNVAPSQVERVLPNGQIEVLGPAPGAPFGTQLQARLAVDARGRVYQITARTPPFSANTFVVISQYASAGGPETLAFFSVPVDQTQMPGVGSGAVQAAVASDGTGYLGFGSSIYRVGVGTNEAIAIYTGPTLLEGGNLIGGLAVGADGSLYWSEHRSKPDFSNMAGFIRRMQPSGAVQTLAGTGVPGFAPDDSLAVSSPIGPMALSLAPDGSIVFLELTGDRGIFNGPLAPRVRRIGTDGRLSTLGGGVEGGFTGDLGDNGPALNARYRFLPGSELSIGPDGDAYMTDGLGHLRAISSIPPGVSPTTFQIPSGDGSEIYEFTIEGRHARTLHALTGATLHTFAYDSSGRLTSVTDGDGLVTMIERNSAGDPTAIVGPFGQRTTLSVDSHGHLATITAPGGGETRLATREDGLLTEFRDANGHASTFTYDAHGRLLTDADAAGGTKTLARTESAGGWTVTVSTTLGRTHGYNVAMGQTGDETTTIAAPDGTSTVTRQRADGTQEAVAADGTRTTVQMGADPRFGMSVVLPASVTVRTPSGLTLSSTVTRTAALADPQDPLSLVTQTETTTVNGRTATTVFDAGTRTFTSTSAGGRVSTSTIDAQGRVTRAQMGSLTPVDFTYDAQGRLTTITQGARTSSIGYDAAGRPSALTDALSRTVGFGYDAADRVTTQTLPDARTIGFGYDAGGNVTSLTPPDRPAHTFAYTPVDLTSSYTPPAVGGAGATGYLFNPDKQPTAIQRPDGQTTGFGYDTGGRLNEVTFSRGLLGYTYDTAGRVATLADPGGVGLTFTYDGALPLGEAWSGPVSGAVTRTFSTDFDVSTEQVNGAFAVAFGYDADRLLTQAGALTIARDAATGLVTSTTLGTTTDTLQYNAFGESTHQTAQVGGTPVFDVGITRDALGRITTRVETVDGFTRVWAYGYDLAGRLATVHSNGDLVAQYTYDGNGNRTAVTGPGGLVEATYDAQDRLLTYGTATYTYTANGELAIKTVGGQTTTYGYDTLGNLITVTQPSGQVITYTVDGRGRRVRKTIDGVPVKGWLYADQLRPIAELDGTGAVVSRFVYGTKPNVPEYVIKNGETYRIVSDNLGTPRVVVHATTGAIVQRFDVHAFGELIVDTNPGWQPFGFAGGLYDPDTGLVRFGARDYDTQAGRWTAKDPIGFELGNDSSRYVYSRTDPVNRVDSSGQWSVSVSAYDGAGGGITFGRTLESGFFLTLRYGMGLGGGVTFDPDGGPPGASPRDCRGVRASVGLFTQAGQTLGTVTTTIGAQAGLRAQAGQNEGGLEPYASYGPNFTLRRWGFSFGYSAGVEVSLQ